MAIESPPAPTGNAELIRWAFGRLNAHDVDALRPYWTPETTERFPDRTCVGPEEIGAWFEELIAAVPDLRMEIEGLAAQDDDVFVRWRLTGTHEGPIQGLAGTGRPIEAHGIDHFVVRDGKVVSNFVVSDRLAFAQQVGMVPRDGTPADRAGKRAFNAITRLRRRLRR